MKFACSARLMSSSDLQFVSMRHARTSPRLIARQAGYRIRTMRVADAEAVARLERTIFAEGWSANVYRKALAAGDTVSSYWVLEEDSVLLGFCGISCADGEAHVVTIGVIPDHRRRGLGELLLQVSLRHARYRRQSTMTLEVRESNLAACQLYLRYCFVAVGRRKGYYSDTHEDALIMTVPSIQGRAFGRLLNRQLERLALRRAATASTATPPTTANLF